MAILSPIEQDRLDLRAAISEALTFVAQEEKIPNEDEPLVQKSHSPP